MIYANMLKATFISRPNRFIAQIDIQGSLEIAHVKNTGRCKELLLPGSDIYVQEFDSSYRKTKYDLISVYKGDRLINIDSQAPNKVFFEWAKAGHFLPNITYIKAETTYRNSRFDFYLEADKKKVFVEVKGVTLEKDGVVMFPDAPTERGVRHIRELSHCVQNGYEAYVVFVVQMNDVKQFTPNDTMHKAFGDVLRLANNYGVNILALDCEVTENSLNINDYVKVIL